jgi:hypothetical protein
MVNNERFELYLRLQKSVVELQTFQKNQLPNDYS